MRLTEFVTSNKSPKNMAKSQQRLKFNNKIVFINRNLKTPKHATNAIKNMARVMMLKIADISNTTLVTRPLVWRARLLPSLPPPDMQYPHHHHASIPGLNCPWSPVVSSGGLLRNSTFPAVSAPQLSLDKYAILGQKSEMS